MRVTFWGAAGTVTGSRFLVEAAGGKLLVDCGLFQGIKPIRRRNWERFPVDPASLDCVVLTHAHIDHSGYLPALVRDGFRGDIWCTDATGDLCRILLPDAAHLQEEDARHANKRGSSRHRPALPLYTSVDAQKALRRLRPQPFVAEESKKITGLSGPMIVLAASGTASGGRVLHHLERLAPDHRNTVAFVGFQATGTRGDALLSGAREIKIFGSYVPVRAEIARIDSLSAHADADELTAWLSTCPIRPRAAYIVHGEPAASDALRRGLRDRLGWGTHVPTHGEAVDWI